MGGDLGADAGRIDAVLAEDAAGAYASMDEPTRERYRLAVRELALWSRASPEAVAREAVELAARNGATGPAAHVGHALLGDLRAELERRLGCRVPPRVRRARFAKAHALGLYLLFVLGAPALAIAGLARLLFLEGLAPSRIVVLCALVAIPAVFLAARVADLAVWTVRPAGRVPRMEPKSSLLEEFPTVVVVPVIVAAPEEVESVLRTLEANQADNPDPHLSWAILTDGPDAPTPVVASDEAILAAARDGVARLNERYAHGAPPRFHHFHRRRRWNENAGVFMGWERKRGKLVQFNALLRGAETDFVADVGDASAVRGARYVITLDADSRLSRGAALELVAIAAHPLNVPRFAEGTNEVVSGFSLFQPAAVARVEAGGTWAALQFTFDPPDDAFEVGRFVGKGLYDVAAFERALDNRIPESSILSHDLLEGMYARTATVLDVHIIDHEPSSVSTFARRLHRWTRGDWQLLPWLLPMVRGADGRWYQNSLGLLHRWRIVRLHVVSLRPVALVAAAGVAWSTERAGPAWLWSVGLVFFVAIDLVLVPAALVARSLASGEGKRAIRRARTFARRISGNVAMNLVLLPFLAWMNADAIVRTFHRLIVRRRLLEWTTAAHAESGSRSGILASFWEMRGVALAVGVIAAAVIALRPHALLAAAPLLLLWMSSPLLAWFVRRGTPE